jgi:Zn-dependent peptidase ImmA (M78 family)
MLLIFAGALLIPRKQLVNELNLFLAKTDPKPQEMIELMGKFNVSPESFYQRLTNILPRLSVKNIFFLRLSHKEEQTPIRLKRATYY